MRISGSDMYEDMMADGGLPGGESLRVLTRLGFATIEGRQTCPNFQVGKPGLVTATRRVVSATALVVSNMIGTIIFTTTGYLAGDLGSAKLVLWIWVVGAV